MTNNKGKITQVIGPVVDVSFDIDKNDLPPIYTAPTCGSKWSSTSVSRR